MENYINNLNILGANSNSANKKVWTDPSVEIISNNEIETGLTPGDEGASVSLVS